MMHGASSVVYGLPSAAITRSPRPSAGPRFTNSTWSSVWWMIDASAARHRARSVAVNWHSNTDIAVVEVYVDHTAGDKLIGKFRNTTSHEIQSGAVDFVLTGLNGTMVGAASVKVNNLAAGETVPFAQPIAEKTATFGGAPRAHR